MTEPEKVGAAARVTATHPGTGPRVALPVVIVVFVATGRRRGRGRTRIFVALLWSGTVVGAFVRGRRRAAQPRVLAVVGAAKEETGGQAVVVVLPVAVEKQRRARERQQAHRVLVGHGNGSTGDLNRGNSQATDPFRPHRFQTTAHVRSTDTFNVDVVRVLLLAVLQTRRVGAVRTLLPPEQTSPEVRLRLREADDADAAAEAAVVHAAHQLPVV